MISISEAANIIREHFEGAKPGAVYIYKDKYYLIFAPRGKGDINTPIYIVGIADGKYRFLNPMEDIDAFNEAMEKGAVKNISG